MVAVKTRDTCIFKLVEIKLPRTHKRFLVIYSQVRIRCQDNTKNLYKGSFTHRNSKACAILLSLCICNSINHQDSKHNTEANELSALSCHFLSLCLLCELWVDHQCREVKLLLILKRSTRRGRKCRVERHQRGVRKHLTKLDAFTVIQSTRPRKQHAPANMQKHTSTQQDIVIDHVTSRGTVKGVNKTS